MNLTLPFARHWVGTPLARKEDAALLSGRARFIDDLAPVPGLKHAAILRSPHPHARIRGIDVRRAAALPGVVGIVTGAELAESGRPDPERRQGAGAVLSVRARQGALRRRAGGRRGRGGSLHRRGRARPDRGGLRAADGGERSRGARAKQARRSCTRRPAPTSSAAAASVTAIRSARSPTADRVFELDLYVPALFLDPDGNLRRHRAVRAGARPLHGVVQLPGPVRAASPDGGRAQGAGRAAAPDHAAPQRRQLRHQAGGVLLHRAARRGRAASSASR